eukprot:TRINITY_DN3888_c0_g1_i12.p1 TRINITY_DN3888_c0_g1~~TRINITY_DN3888_c0_g1_i12.p1  ORF type:complete len:165 (-),score=26.39 TRINITY_DN3888_c0_g1_i12:167-661(-)
MGGRELTITLSLLDHPFHVFLEMSVLVLLVAEVILRAISQQKDYLKRWENIFDLFVIVFSALTLVFFWLSGKYNFAESLRPVFLSTDTLLLGFRYLSLCLRATVALKNSQSMINVQQVGTNFLEPVRRDYEDHITNAEEPKITILEHNILFVSDSTSSMEPLTN